MSDKQSNYQSTSISNDYHFPTKSFSQWWFMSHFRSWHLIISTFFWQLKATQFRVSLKRGTLKCQKLPTLWNWTSVRLVSCWGISPKRLFRERSKDSSSVRFPNDDGIWLIKLFPDKLSTISALRFPMLFGISP